MTTAYVPLDELFRILANRQNDVPVYASSDRVSVVTPYVTFVAVVEERP